MINEANIIDSIKKKGYSGKVIQISNNKKEEKEKKKELKKLRFKVILSAFFAIPTFILGMFFMKSPLLPGQDFIMWVLATPIQFYIGWQFYQGAWTALKNHSANMDTLIAMGTSAAYFYSVYVVLSGTDHQYFEASAVLITLVIFGNLICSNSSHLPASKGYPVESNELMVMVLDSGE